MTSCKISPLPVVYLQRRFLPSQEPTVLTKHTVTEGDRLDNITARYLGDPTGSRHYC